MTLAGLSLGIGMLVDNSVVVIENIYRLRSRGVPGGPRRRAGAQSRWACPVVASTLTSVCVFLPVVFSSSTCAQPAGAHVPVHRLLPDGLPHRGRHGGARRLPLQS